MGCSQSKAPATPAARTARVESARESLDGRSWAAHASYELPPRGPPRGSPAVASLRGGCLRTLPRRPHAHPRVRSRPPRARHPAGRDFATRIRGPRRRPRRPRRGAVAVPRPPRRAPRARACALPGSPSPPRTRPRLRPRSSPTIPARASARVFARRGRLRVSSSTRSTGDSSGRRRTSPRSRVRCTSSVAETETIETETIGRPGPRLSRPRPGPTLGGQRLFQFCRRSRRRRRMRTTHARAPCRPGRGRPARVRDATSRTTQKKSRRVRRRRRRPTGRRALVRVHTRHTRVRSRRRETRRRRERRGGGFEPTRT